MPEDVVVDGFSLQEVQSRVPCMSENGLRTLCARYLARDEAGNIEHPAEMFRRVADTVAAPEGKHAKKWSDKFYEMMINGRFMPNSPTLMNAGRKFGMLSACFVLPIEDNLHSILDTQRAVGIIQAMGGGTGFTLDELRATGTRISGSGGTTSGPISFWRALTETTSAIQQGSYRRGANLMCMSLWHPDIIKFLFAKQNLAHFVNYNISVKITNSEMDTITNSPATPLVVRNPYDNIQYYVPKKIITTCKQAVQSSIDSAMKYNLLDTCYSINDLVPVDSKLAGDYITYGDLWSIITNNAWRTGEPGVLFIDNIEADNTIPHIGKLNSTNPCSELPLLIWESCTLASMNVNAYVFNGSFDKGAFKQDTETAVRFLDNVIDTNRLPLPELVEANLRSRKIGIGLMGFADALFSLGIPYNSNEGLKFADELVQFFDECATNASIGLAKERGVFPAWKGSTWEAKDIRIRNATVTTIAPTGTISIIANCSGGIEPLFALVFTRKVLDGQVLLQTHDYFESVAKEKGFYSEALIRKVAEAGTLKGLHGIPPEIRKTFVVAADIEPKWHVLMQATFQKFIQNSISKTVNMPNEATVADVSEVYRLAYENSCKGVTIYRDGARENQPMSIAKKEEIVIPEPKPVPGCAPSFKIRRETVFGNMHVNITVDMKTGRELEVFAQVGRGGDLISTSLESLCRLISLWLRANGSISDIIRQLAGIGSTLPTETRKATSLANELTQAILTYLELKSKHGLAGLFTANIKSEGSIDADDKILDNKNMDDLKKFVDLVTNSSGTKVKCPTNGCPGFIIFQEGCSRCSACSFTGCS